MRLVRLRLRPVRLGNLRLISASSGRILHVWRNVTS